MLPEALTAEVSQTAKLAIYARAAHWPEIALTKAIMIVINILITISSVVCRTARAALRWIQLHVVSLATPFG